MAKTKIADISHYQGKIDWRKAATELAFCILRASVGVNNDKKYAEYARGCKENGIPYGTYHYLKATDFDAAINEAEIFFRAATQGAPLFYVVDCEYGDITNAEKKKKGIAKSIVNAFVFHLKELAGSGARVGVYIGHHLYKSWALDYSSFAFTWIPRYGKNSGSPETRPDYPCHLWQYTSKGRLAGVSGNADLNLIVGDKPLEYFTGTGAPEPEQNEGGNDMAHDPKKVIAIAEAEVGYLEKASNKSLDDKTANAGSKNYTRYARDMDAIAGYYNGKKQGVAWCDIFIDWCFMKAFGAEEGRKLLCQPLKSSGAGCRYSRNYFKAKGQLYDSPEAGDQIFFWPSDRSDPNVVAHTGLVYAVDKSYVYTIEGNTSSASGVVANGGCVRKKKYALNYARIAGYGRPNYGMKVEPGTPSAPATPKLGDRTLRKGDKGNDVKELQTALKGLGYDLGTYGDAKDGVDGDFGSKTQTAVKALQKKRGITVNGVFDTPTYNALLEAMSPEPAPAEPDRDTYVLVIEGDKDALRAIQAEHGGTLAAAGNVKIVESGTA